MYRSRNSLVAVGLSGLVALLVLAGLTWGNYRFAQANPGGNDFLYYWRGTQVLLKEGISPYSDEAVQQIQILVYGETGSNLEPHFSYPLYSIVFFAPFALVNQYDLARALWMTLLEISLLWLTITSLKLVRWQPNLYVLGFLLLFSLVWYHGMRPLINGNVVILIAAFLVAGFMALKSGAEELAGVLFAFATIKPQVVVLVLTFVVFWGMNNRRWRMVGWMVGSVFLLSISASLIFPDWLLQNLREVIRYAGFGTPATPSDAFELWWPAFGERLGYALSGLMLIILLIEWRAARKADLRGFLWTAFLTLTISQWIGIPTDPGNFVVLFPALVLVLGLFAERWNQGAVILTAASLVLLMGGLWWIFLATVENTQQSPVMFFPLPAVMLVLLYWVRWWAVTPPRAVLDQFD